MKRNISCDDEKTKEFVYSDPTNHFLQHLAEKVAALAPYIYQSTAPKNRFVPPVSSFITLLAKRSRVKSGTLLSSLIIMEKLKRKIERTRSSALHGLTLHTVFLGCVIVTTKYLHDSSPKNTRWSKYAAYFTLEDINRMERKVLITMEHHLKITKRDFDAAIDNYYCTIPLHMFPGTSMFSDLQYLPKAASVSTFDPLFHAKPSSFNSIVNHFKSGFSELRKIPNGSSRSKNTDENKPKNPSRFYDSNTISKNVMSMPEENNRRNKSQYRPQKTLAHSQSLLNTNIPSGNLLLSLSEHISSSSLTSESTADNDSVLTLNAENSNCEANLINDFKIDLTLKTSPTNFGDELLNSEWMQRFGGKETTKSKQRI